MQLGADPLDESLRGGAIALLVCGHQGFEVLSRLRWHERDRLPQTLPKTGSPSPLIGFAAAGEKVTRPGTRFEQPELLVAQRLDRLYGAGASGGHPGGDGGDSGQHDHGGRYRSGFEGAHAVEQDLDEAAGDER